MINPEENPYQAPAQSERCDTPPDDRGGALATFLMLLWLAEGSLKLLFLAWLMADVEGGLTALAQPANSMSRGWFALGCAFFSLETIGPWIGFYYLVQCKRGRITFERAIGKTLALAGAAALAATALLLVAVETRA